MHPEGIFRARSALVLIIFHKKEEKYG